MKSILKNPFKGQILGCATLIYLLVLASCSSTVHTTCSAELRFDPETKFLWHKNKIVGEVHLNTSINTMRIFYPTIGAKIYSTVIGGGVDIVSYKCFKLFAFEDLVQREKILKSFKLKPTQNLKYLSPIPSTRLDKRISAYWVRNKLEPEKKKRERWEATYITAIYKRLSQSTDPIEGVYRSVEDNRSDEYEVAILKSSTSPNTYDAHVLSVLNNSNVNVGSVLFSIEQTAQSNVFFHRFTTVYSQYGRRWSEDKNNRLANLNGAILETSVGSFVKTILPEQSAQEVSEVVSSQGSGFFINSNGYIVTNHHVIKDATSVIIEYMTDDSKKVYAASVVADDPDNDLAILKITSSEFEFLDELPYKILSEPSRVGTKVLALGYPKASKLGSELKATNGIINALSFERNPRFYQISAPIDHGSSGGALFDDNAHLIGITAVGIPSIELANGAIKSSYLVSLANSVNPPLTLASNNSELSDKQLPDQIDRLRDFMVMIHVYYD
jgi:S1-C subfamily serine protease